MRLNNLSLPSLPFPSPGELYECIADTGRALKLEDSNLEALELRGRAYYMLGDLEMAMNHYRQVRFLHRVALTMSLSSSAYPH